MPLAELMNKWKSGSPMSNGKKVQSQKQALAIAASEGSPKGKKKSKKKKAQHPMMAALMASKKSM